MSAAGRTPGLRVPQDNYATPPWCVDRILERLPLPTYKLPPQDGAFAVDGLPHDVKPAYWLDPCAGSGQLIRAAQAYHASRGLALPRWQAVEVRPECEASLVTVANPVIISDFLRVVPASYEVVLTNPPYSLAEEFVRACLPIAKNIVMLLRLNWLENKDELLKEHPADVYVLPNRPPFGRDKKGKISTDATAYAWFHWSETTQGRIVHLARTPKKVRGDYRKWLDETLPRRANGSDRDAAEPKDEATPAAPGHVDAGAASGVGAGEAGAPSRGPALPEEQAPEAAGPDSFGGEDFPDPGDLLDGPLRYR